MDVREGMRARFEVISVQRRQPGLLVPDWTVALLDLTGSMPLVGPGPIPPRRHILLTQI